MVISVDDGLLRSRTICICPSFSLTLYVDWLNDTVATIRENMLVISTRKQHTVSVAMYTVWHKTLVVEIFGGSVPKIHTLVDWLHCEGLKV